MLFVITNYRMVQYYSVVPAHLVPGAVKLPMLESCAAVVYLTRSIY